MNTSVSYQADPPHFAAKFLPWLQVLEKARYIVRYGDIRKPCILCKPDKNKGELRRMKFNELSNQVYIAEFMCK